MSLYLRNSEALTSQLHSRVPELAAYRTAPKAEYTLQSVPLEIISSAAVPSQSYQWKYTVRIAQLQQSDQTWHDTEVEGFPFAFNGWEAGNTATAVKVLGGNNPSTLTSGYTVNALPDGMVTWGHVQYFKDADASTSIDEWCYFLINEPNPIVGACS